MAELTLTSASYAGRYLELVCTQTQDIANNKSTIDWTLSSKGGSSNYYSTGPTTVTINGQQVYYKGRTSWSDYEFPAAIGSKTGNLVVNHNTNGTKSISVSLSTVIYEGESKLKTVSETWQLDAIPRGATITSAPDFNDDATSLTVGYSNPAGNNATSVQIAVLSENGADTLIGYRTATKTGTSYNITNITSAERTALRQYIISGSSRTVAYRIKTVIGSNTFYGTDVKKTLSLVDYTPLLLDIRIEDTHITTQQYISNGSQFLEGLNEISYNLSAEGRKGATIAEYKIECGTLVGTGYSGRLHNVTNNAFTITVTDTRGNTSTYTERLTMLPYTKVSCKQDVSIELSGETTASVNVVASGNYTNEINIQGANELTVFYRIKEGNGSYGGWTTTYGTRTVNNGTYREEFTVDGLDYTKTYTIQCWAYDYFTTAESTPYTITLKPIFDWSDTDFNFNVPISINNIELDYIVEQGTSNGWYYRKWNSGKGECFKTITVNTAVNTAWGNMYCGTKTTRQKYPFTFAAVPTELVTLQSTYAAGILMCESGNAVNSTTESAIYNVCRPNAVTASNQFNYSFYVCGRWK